MDNKIHRRLLESAESIPTVVAATPAETANSTAEAELSQANFDTNMVIILAALLCALICAIGLNSVVRCVLRCSRRDMAEEEEAARVSATGLKKSVLRKIPILVFGRDYEGSGRRDEHEECPICLGEFVDGDKVRVLPKCNHGFHVRCIDTWLGSHSSCPNCRHLVVDASNALSKAVESVHAGGDSGGGGRDHVVVEMNALGN
ncbi:RING-H2 finger protein ATL74-like [Silene latifolia]|uniref:RING-H2 finger protein ATL74-like n=1 Tax=Silene latifolia TaxID=37657 RepID=UPI003D777672